MNEAFLRVSDLSAGYGAIEILDGIGIEVRAREIVAVLGANGAGKTTLNNTLSGLIRASRGTVMFDGVDITRAESRRIVELGLIHVPEGRRVFPNLTVRENLELGSYRRGRAHRARNFDRVLQIFPRLAERTRQLAGSLSGGEQQMLAIGRGLMPEPRLLILDEPSLGLAPLLVEEMFALVRRLNGEGLAIILVEQNVVQSLDIADRAYVIANGRVALAGNAKEIMNDPALKRSYLGA